MSLTPIHHDRHAVDGYYVPELCSDCWCDFVGINATDDDEGICVVDLCGMVLAGCTRDTEVLYATSRMVYAVGPHVVSDMAGADVGKAVLELKPPGT